MGGKKNRRRRRAGNDIVSHYAVAAGEPFGKTYRSGLQNVESPEGDEGGKPPAPVERHCQKGDPLSGDLVDDNG